ncbi:hypothetical protein [Methyloceanibacter sp.]|jgi:hypothetical protein|uniref:hypothetical protein n=1 Tax=Methyloceanibacter sp. TaxID=1965321 RepID=UPI00351BB07B
MLARRDSSATLIARRFAPRIGASHRSSARPSLSARIAALPWNEKQRGDNSMLTLSDAANAAGVAKSTIWRAIKSGRLSASRSVVGSYQVDAAELFRVFPAVRKNDPTQQVATGTEHVGTAAQEAQIAALKDISGLLRDQIEDLRKDRDAWRGQAESNQRLLIDARKRRGIFGWGSRTL